MNTNKNRSPRGLSLAARTLLVAAIGLHLAAPASSQCSVCIGNQIHVDDDAPAGGDGTSWATAFNNLEDALAASGLGTCIWVATGTYYPSNTSGSSDPRDATFTVLPMRWLFGGFAGNEVCFEDRANDFQNTILSGNIGQADVVTDNAYRVVSVRNPQVLSDFALIDGFWVSDGYNDTASSQGAGIHCDNSRLNLINSFVADNYAGYGAGLFAQPGAVHVLDTLFLRNTASIRGGAFYGQNLAALFYNTEFRGNSATRGGAVYIQSIPDSPNVIPPTFVNSIFRFNQAERGGAAYIGGGTYSQGIAQFTNCTFNRNTATVKGGAVLARINVPFPAISTIDNSILWNNESPNAPELWGNHTVRYTDIEGGWAGAGNNNLSVDPLFVPGNSLRVGPTSPTLDVGSNNRLQPDYIDMDFDYWTS